MSKNAEQNPPSSPETVVPTASPPGSPSSDVSAFAIGSSKRAAVATGKGKAAKSTVRPTGFFRTDSNDMTRSPGGSIRSHIGLEPTSARPSGSDDPFASENGTQMTRSGPDGASTANSGSQQEQRAWDDSDDDDYDFNTRNRFLRVKRKGEESDSDDGFALPPGAKGKAKARNGTASGPPHFHSSTLRGFEELETRDYSNLSSLKTLLPSRMTFRRWWAALTSNPSQPASLSVFTVALNLFSTSLHPAVLLSLPFYFSRTEIPLGMAGLSAVAALGGVGGGLWVVLGRYVNANNVENIVGASFARHSRWRAELGRTITGLLLGTYATGSAFIAYFALADLLLQIFFHYSPRGIPLHDRAFVTLLIGGVFTTPLLVLPLAKRTLIRLNSALSLILYPVVLAILLAKIYTWTAEDLPALVNDEIGTAIHPVPHLPNANPFSPPSIWGPYSLLPLLTLSSSPLQIMQHQSSLRRKGLSGSNVKAFMGAQTAQVLAVVGICAGFGIGVGLNGMHQRLKLEVHPNLFTSLPKDDDTVNLARLLFVFLLSTHLALCIVTARSSWSRILRRFKLNPLRRRQDVHQSSSGLPKTRAEPSRPRHREGSCDAHGLHSATSADEGHETGPQTGGSASSSPAKPFAIANGSSRRPKAPPKKVKAPRRWGKLARNALAGLILWALVAGLAYMSGNGRIRRGGGEKDGEEARFTRASEILGLLGAAVGFVIPSLVWVILFWIRRPRNILQIGASDNIRDLERRPLLPRTSQDAGEGSSSGNRLHPPSSHVASQGDHWHSTFQAVPVGGGGGKNKKRADNATIQAPDWDSEDEGHRGKLVKTWVRDQDGEHMDEATTILLAKKELQMQKQTRGERRWQDLLVIGGVLPLGVALLLLGAIELRAGGY